MELKRTDEEVNKHPEPFQSVPQTYAKTLAKYICIHQRLNQQPAAGQITS
jgi:hypothetical protein